MVTSMKANVVKDDDQINKNPERRMKNNITKFKADFDPKWNKCVEA